MDLLHLMINVSIKLGSPLKSHGIVCWSTILEFSVASSKVQTEDVMCANAFRTVVRLWEQQPWYGELERGAYYTGCVMRSSERQISLPHTHARTHGLFCGKCETVEDSNRVPAMLRSPDGDAVWSTELFDTDSSCCCPVFKWRRTTPARCLWVLIRLSLLLFLSLPFFRPAKTLTTLDTSCILPPVLCVIYFFFFDFSSPSCVFCSGDRSMSH